MEDPWRDVAADLVRSEPFRQLREGDRTAVGLPAPAADWVIELLATELEWDLLVVVPRDADAIAWVEASALFTPERRSLYFPGPSLSPYQQSDVSLKVRAEEVVALDRLAAGTVRTVVLTPRALFRRLPPLERFLSDAWTVRPDEALDVDRLLAHLVVRGYRRTDLVQEVGDVAVRGGVFDLFPPAEELPVRIDLFGDSVESLRPFDPLSQRSSGLLDSLRILPLELFPAGAPAMAELASSIALRAPGPGLETAERLESLARGDGFPGWRHLLPLLGETVVVRDLLPGSVVVVLAPEVLRREVEHHARELEDEHQVRVEKQRFTVPPELLEHPRSAVEAILGQARVVVSDGVGAPAGGCDFRAAPTDVFHGQLPRFPREVEMGRRRGETVRLVAAPEHFDRVRELLEGLGVPLGGEGVELVAGRLGRGFRLPPAGLLLFGEEQLVRQVGRAARRRRDRLAAFIPSLRDLKVGDFVVHVDHGIGQFVGLRAVEGAGADALANLPPTLASAAPPPEVATEVMEITYRGGRTLLLPLSRLDQLQKYGGIEGLSPRLDSLGGTSWNRTKSRVKKSLRQLAENLLVLYAERRIARAPVMARDSDLQRQVESAFPFEETDDQLQAIEEIKADLERERPMDRLLCGDVGFGKTEVAMRAAFKVVDSGHQVAVLAPTTILADQHLETFRERFAGFPVEVEMISRFRSSREIREIRERVEAGRVDILVGTHRLLSQDVELPRLGLVIIDEEQRFGVAQKERLTSLRKNVHVLAMSATPVPRTLQLSLAGVRDLSMIETPPRDRMAIETAILPMNTEVIREAIEFELARGGQIYYVHNRVEGIDRVAAFLSEVVPGLRITVGHGQMDEHELARRMHAFHRGEYDLLLATTIIENGIHIPRVNTMVVHRADRFGLAQLYQLRGRVGRSDQLAYCYLLVAEDRVLSEVARKRLATLREFSDLGAGFRIAARDLEIRGAGNLLGAEQSGHIAAVGIETYVKMLEEAVAELRGEKVRESFSATLDLPVPMAIPSDYVTDPNLRMEIYQKIAKATDGVREELEDRFGPVPAAVDGLLAAAEVKRRAEEIGVQAVSWERGRLTLRLRQDAVLDLERLVEMVESRPGTSFSPSGVLTLTVGRAEVVTTACRVLEALGP